MHIWYFPWLSKLGKESKSTPMCYKNNTTASHNYFLNHKLPIKSCDDITPNYYTCKLHSSTPPLHFNFSMRKSHQHLKLKSKKLCANKTLNAPYLLCWKYFADISSWIKGRRMAEIKNSFLFTISPTNLSDTHQDLWWLKEFWCSRIWHLTAINLSPFVITTGFLACIFF